MAVAVTLCKINYIDANGGKAVQDYYFAGAVTDPAGTEPAAMVAAVEGISNAAVSKLTLLLLSTTTSGSAAAGPYESVQDKLAVVGIDASGLMHTIEMPSPIDTIWLPDHETVDPANSNWLSFKTALMALWKGSNGEAMTYVRAFRKMTRQKSYN